MCINGKYLISKSKLRGLDDGSGKPCELRQADRTREQRRVCERILKCGKEAGARCLEESLVYSKQSLSGRSSPPIQAMPGYLCAHLKQDM